MGTGIWALNIRTLNISYVYLCTFNYLKNTFENPYRETFLLSTFKLQNITINYYLSVISACIFKTQKFSAKRNMKTLNQVL